MMFMMTYDLSWLLISDFNSHFESVCSSKYNDDGQNED